MVKGMLPDIAVTMVCGREIHGAFSLIVDDVDSSGESISMSAGGQNFEGSSCTGSGGSSQETSRSYSHPSSSTPLECLVGPRERIKRIQVEAETRRGEFARLLEEHAQVVRKLKMMEAEEQLNVGAASATTSTIATPASGANVIGPTHA
ncbi:uncharacterized protein LOC105691832 isoform X2 [Athalia rosae]|uniref:uncharacterized protein LOC105691832 isoform X2 n=1 Tax=Athalia rosae TaxID=37344 RepID=UPI000625EECB|nr:uncharacterized protein LOC105691832 isoform X2 [Athalia rosae]